MVGADGGKATPAPRQWEDADMTKGTVGLVLAAGAGSRFGGGKLLATIAGRAVLQHVLDALAEAGVGESVVVLGKDAERIEAAIDWGSARRGRLRRRRRADRPRRL